MSRASKRRAMKGRKPVTVAQSPWDHGADGPANRVGLVVEERGEIDPKTGKMQNPNGVTGVRRVDMLEIYHKRGWISTQGYNAAELLRTAWLRNEIGKCPPWLRERVDSSPKPDTAVTIQIDRMSALMRISRLVPADDERIVGCVCYGGNAIGSLREYRGSNHESGKAHLRKALDGLAERIEALARNF